MKAFVFPGQGSQFSGMGKELYQNSAKAKQYFEQANQILGFDISSIMFEGSDEELRQTKVTQPAIFIHSVILAKITEGFDPDMVAGHSLGEFSALVSAGVLSFEEGLKLVSKRALAMQAACENNPSGMAAILGLEDEKVEQICANISAAGNVVVAANYNCPGQLVISGSNKGIELACVAMKEAGAKRALPLPVGGAFHSPLMDSARQELEKAIKQAHFNEPICPIYQNVNAAPSTNIENIKTNLIAQLTAPVRWTQSVKRMIDDGASIFVECGPGKVLQGLVKKISPTAEVTSF
jgi:[acyl-carrier-protein] S-malonyltransferase